MVTIFINVLLYILMSIASYIISGFIHELGHVIVGLANGWKFFILVIGPLGFRLNEQDKVVCYYEKEKLLWGGIGGTIPQTEDPDNIKVWKKVLLGGPITSIIMGIIILPIGIIIDNLFLVLLGVMPISMGIACMLPLKTGIFYTDGGRWMRLNKDGKGQREEIALFNLTQNEAIHKDYLKVDYNDVVALKESENLNIKYYGHYYGYKYYKHKSNIVGMEEEEKEMRNMQAKIPRFIVDDCKLDDKESNDKDCI